MTSTKRTDAWAEVDAWELNQHRIWTERRIELFKLDWMLMPSDDGKLWARRVRDTDEPGEPIEGEPEVKADSFEVLVATIKALNGTHGGAA